MNTNKTQKESGAASVRAFADTLPAQYRERFNPAEIAAHAHIVGKRRGTSVSVGIFPWRHPEVTAICVNVEDRPGLMAVISSALAQLGFSVRAAEAYSREYEDGKSEVLDVFWLSDLEGKVSPDEVAAFESLLTEILEGRRAEEVPVLASLQPGNAGTTVRFVEGSAGDLSVLEVETADRSWLLYSITRALHQSDVQIVGSQIRTESERVLDRFVIEELSGARISDSRRLSIQVAVLSALEM